MRKRKLLFLFSLLLSICLYAQQPITISGKVIDGTNAPLPGASVVIKGRTVGTVADYNGAYVLKVQSGETLVFSFVGMTSKEVKVTTQKVINVTLESSRKLDEVVVVGYGTVKKSDLTGAVGSIKTEDLLKGNPTSVVQGLQGKLAGVQVQQSDGAPGAGINIQVRGANSFNTSTEPLYVIDGIPFETGGTPSSSVNSNNLQSTNALAMLNPQDIQSIEVLKDASATAIYGSRGANGVVLITTKRGEKGSAKVEFSTNFGISKIIKKVDVLNAYQYANYRNEQVINRYNYEGVTYSNLPYDGHWQYTKDNSGTVVDSTYFPTPDDFLNGYMNGGTNWQDQIFQTAMSHEYNLSMSGADDKGYYVISGNMLNQDGIIKKSGYDRYSARLNVARKVHPWLELGLNTSYTNSITNFSKSNSSDYAVIRSALVFPPDHLPEFNEHTDTQLSWLSANPYLYVTTAKDQVTSNNVFNSAFAELKFTDYLKFRQNLGYGYNMNTRNTYYNRNTQEGASYSNINGKAGLSDNWYTSLTMESLLQFDKSFGKKHTINAVLGTTRETANYGGKSIVATNFPTDITGEYDISQGLNQETPTSSRGQNKLISLLGRINYSLMSKYLFTVSYRRDGSSKFSDSNKWADFMSGAIAWRASEEKFIKDLNIFSNLKLRASYGETGNQGIGSYSTMSLLQSANYPVGGSLQSGFAEPVWRGPVNPNLKWETTAQSDAGVDMGFFNNRVNLTVDLFYKKTRDLLQNVKIPLSTGFGQMQVNYGTVTNKGVEVTGKFYVLTKTPLKWDFDANISFIKNRIGDLPGDQYATRLWSNADRIFIQRNGMPIGAIFGYVEDGFYDNEAEVRADKAFTNASAAIVKAKIGEIKYRDYDNSGSIDEKDKRLIGDTNPKFTYGFTNNFSWKNFNASFYIQGTYGNDIFNGNLMEYQVQGYQNIPSIVYNSRWTAENTTNAKWPKATSGYQRNMLISNRFVEDGSYLRLKNLNIGYTFKRPIKQVQDINVYCSATNLFTITNYSWLDPDVNAFGGDASRRGVDIYSYPSSRTFSFGAKLTF